MRSTQDQIHALALPTPCPRHRRRYMGALGRLCHHLRKLAEMLQHRYRSEEVAETLAAHLDMIEECRTPADARDVLGQLIEERVPGAIKPPQLEVRINAAIAAMFAAALQDSDWPALLIEVADQTAAMFDPYDAAANDIGRLPTGSYVIVIGEVPQGARMVSPAASQPNSLASSSLPPKTSARTRRSPSGKVAKKAAETGTIAGALS